MSLDGGEDTQPDFDADATLAAIESPEHEIPMTSPESPAPAEEFEFQHSGKVIKGTRDQFTKWASMGYDAPNRIGELNKQLEGFKGREQKFKEYESKYAPVDEYFSKNPDHWKTIEEGWKQRQAALDPSNPLAAELNNVKQTLQDLTKFKDELSTEKVTQKRQAEDAELDKEVQSIRESHPDLDWSTPNERGLSLEKQVLQHGMEIGTKSFRAAFRDFTHDMLMKKAQDTGKQAITKDIQKRTKLGLLGETRTPTKGISHAKDVRNQSYEDLMQEALDEHHAISAS